MNSQESIQALQALRNTIASQIVGLQAQVDALDVAFKLLQDGYQEDSERIAVEIAKFAPVLEPVEIMKEEVVNEEIVDAPIDIVAEELISK